MKKNKAFTLIELLVVIAIIGVLSSIVLVSIQGARERAQTVKMISFSSQVYRALGANIIGKWDLNGSYVDPSGYYDTDDSSGYNNHATFNGLTSYYSWICGGNDSTIYHKIGQGQGNCSIEFLNNQADIRVVSSPVFDQISDEVTLEAWLYPRSLPLWGFFFRKQNSFYFTTRTVAAGTYLRVSFTGLAPFSFDSKYIDMEINKWHHVLATYNGSDNLVKIYFNGEEIDSLPASGEISSSENNLSIGGAGSAVAFLGRISGVKIYSKALNSAEVKSLYYAGLNNL